MFSFIKNLFSKKPVFHYIRCLNCGCRFNWDGKWRDLKCPNCDNSNLKKFNEISTDRRVK